MADSFPPATLLNVFATDNTGPNPLYSHHYDPLSARQSISAAGSGLSAMTMDGIRVRFLDLLNMYTAVGDAVAGRRDVRVLRAFRKSETPPTSKYGAARARLGPSIVYSEPSSDHQSPVFCMTWWNKATTLVLNIAPPLMQAGFVHEVPVASPLGNVITTCTVSVGDELSAIEFEIEGLPLINTPLWGDTP